ncbi:hypothetical protein Tco_1114712 [Tanacetum coccineum]|uniref:Uncharacterized protein n=1 Tax=Tanacetum coccineum TaxID=301880 RepID=A0ABQ5IVW7_9ASTR
MGYCLLEATGFLLLSAQPSMNSDWWRLPPEALVSAKGSSVEITLNAEKSRDKVPHVATVMVPPMTSVSSGDESWKRKELSLLKGRNIPVPLCPAVTEKMDKNMEATPAYAIFMLKEHI